MPGSALKIETTRRQLAVASGCLPGLVDSARYRRRFWSDFRPACRLSGSAGLPGSCLLLPAGSRLPGRSRLPGLTLRSPRHSTRQQLPYTLRCERFAFGCLIARGITDRCAKKVKLFPVVVFEFRARGSINSPEKQGFSGERDMATPSTSSLKT